MTSTQARAHGDSDFLQRKQARLEEPHVKPIQDLVRRIRLASGDPAVPFVDPDGGGVAARVLLLLEAPGQSRRTRQRHALTRQQRWNRCQGVAAV